MFHVYLKVWARFPSYGRLGRLDSWGVSACWQMIFDLVKLLDYADMVLTLRLEVLFTQCVWRLNDG